MVGLMQLKHVGLASYVSFGSALSSVLSCPWISPDIRRACRELNASTAAVENVTARTIVVRISSSHYKFLKNDDPEDTAGELAYRSHDELRSIIVGGSSSSTLAQPQNSFACLVSRQTTPC